MSKLIAHLRAQWMGALALFLVIAGGTAYAADTIGSSDVIDNSLLSADLANNKAVRSGDVKAESLTGADIADQSGVDTCTHGTARFGELCVQVANTHDDWFASSTICTDLGLRLPSLGEARVLGSGFDLPNVDPTERFWTEEMFQPDGTTRYVWTVDDDGDVSAIGDGGSAETVCVTTPTN
jgi:hypothetical protein